MKTVMGRTRRLGSFCILLFASLLTGCASFYVDTATKDVAPSEMKKVAQPKPVQVVFEFQTKSAPNSQATQFLQAQVLEQVKSSGLFSTLDSKPVAGGGMLSIVLNNVPSDDAAFAKGFTTGLTFGLAGSKVTDGYVCTLTYLPAGQSKPVVAVARHAIHTALGNTSAPTNAIKAESGEAAVRTMTRQIVGTALKELSFNSEMQ